MEDGSTPPQRLGAEVGNMCLESRRGQIVSTRTCRISRLQAMACMACTPRDLNPLRTRILPLLPESRTPRIRLARGNFLLGFSSPPLPLHPIPANKLRGSTRIDHLRGLPHNGPTHHLRTSPTTPTTPTDHNPKHITGRNNPHIPNHRTRTRPEGRLQGSDRSLPSKAGPRTLVLAGMSMPPANSLNLSNHVTLPPFLHTPHSPDPRTPLARVFRIRICKMRLRSSGLNWSRSVDTESSPLICAANYPCLWCYVDERPTRVHAEGFQGRTRCEIPEPG